MSPDSSVSSLEFYRKQSKALFRAARAAEPDALARICVHLPHFTPGQPFLLSDAQWIIAREHGFASWPKFKHHVESLPVTPSSASYATGNASPACKENQPIQEIKTANWVSIHTRWDRQTGETIDHSFAHQNWIRLDPPVKAWRGEDDNSWSHHVIDENGLYYTASAMKVCDFDPRPNPVLSRDLLEEALFPPPSNEGDTADAISSTRQYRDWNREPVELGGRNVLRWSHEMIRHNYRVMKTIWTEPETHRIVRKERQEIDLLTGKRASMEVCDQYLYNTVIPEETFQMPPGKRVVTPDDENFMPEVWDTLSPEQRQAIQETIHRSDAGWKDADFSAFASVWKFGCLDYLPDQSQWQERIAQQVGLWMQWISEVESANIQHFIPLQVDTHSFTWSGKRKVLWVTVRLRVEWGQDGFWEGKASFGVRRYSRYYRIVHWECPWEEIKAARTAK